MVDYKCQHTCEAIFLPIRTVNLTLCMCVSMCHTTSHETTEVLKISGIIVNDPMSACKLLLRVTPTQGNIGSVWVEGRIWTSLIK